MHSPWRSPPAIALLVCICGLGVFRAPLAASAARAHSRRHLAFEPKRDKKFDFTFARRDSDNCYRLSLRRGRLKLEKVVRGTAASLAAIERIPEFTTVGVWLRPDEIRVELDGRAVLLSDDTTFRDGGFALDPPGAAAGPVRENSPGAIALEEDFEDHPAVRERWEVLLGSYKVFARMDELALRNGGPPTFCAYQPSGRGDHLAAAGEAYWTDLQLQATLRLKAAKRAGLAFNIVDGRNFSAFVITPGANGRGKAQLLDFRDATPREVAVAEDLKIDREQWYRLKVETYADRAWCSILGLPGGGWRTIFPGSGGENLTGRGRVGLISWGGGALFDDVSARSFQSFADTMKSPRPAVWKCDDNWRRPDAAPGFARLARWPGGPGRIDVELIPAGIDSAGIFTHSPNDRSYYAFGLFGGRWQFRRVLNWGLSVLAAAPARKAEAHRLTLIDRRGVFRCLVDDAVVFEVADFSLPAHGGGLIGRGSAFRNFRIAEDPGHGGVEIFTTDFGEPKGIDKVRMQRAFIIPDILEPSGPVWGYEKLDESPSLVSDEPGTLLFHASIPGDVSLTATVSRNGTPGVLIGSGPEQGYRFGVDEEDRNAVLYRNGRAIAHGPIAGGKKKVTLTLAKRGPTLLTYVDSKPMMKYTDRAPLKGGRVGLVAGRGGRFFGLSIRAEFASACSFKNVSPRWQEAGEGQWALHAGLPDPELGHWITAVGHKGPAYLWERVGRRGDFVWYVTVAPATEGYADGGSSTFPIGNVHLKFCSDPENPSTGYDLVLRPNGKNEMALFRGAEKVAEAGFTTPQGRPVRIAVSKQKGSIEVFADGQQVLAVEDPHPFDSGRLALGVEGGRVSFLDVLVLPAMPAEDHEKH